MFEHDIRCAFDLLDRPCVAGDRAIPEPDSSVCKYIQDFMETFRVNPVRKLLCSCGIRDFEESVIVHAVRDSLLLQFMGEEVMAVHIELQSERRPCGDTQAT